MSMQTSNFLYTISLIEWHDEWVWAAAIHRLPPIFNIIGIYIASYPVCTYLSTYCFKSKNVYRFRTSKSILMPTLDVSKAWDNLRSLAPYANTSRHRMSSAKDADSIPIADATFDPIEHAVPVLTLLGNRGAGLRFDQWFLCVRAKLIILIYAPIVHCCISCRIRAWCLV